MFSSSLQFHSLLSNKVRYKYSSGKASEASEARYLVPVRGPRHTNPRFPALHSAAGHVFLSRLDPDTLTRQPGCRVLGPPKTADHDVADSVAVIWEKKRSFPGIWPRRLPLGLARAIVGATLIK